MFDVSRQDAKTPGRAVAGTLGVLVESSLCGHVSFEDGLERLLTRTNFRVSEAVVAAARARVAGRLGST